MCTLTQGASICSVDLQQCDSLQFCCYSDPNQVCRYHPMNQARIQNVLFSPLCSFLHVHQTQRSMCISFVFCGEWFFSHQLFIQAYTHSNRFNWQTFETFAQCKRLLEYDESLPLMNALNWAEKWTWPNVAEKFPKRQKCDV